jgi:hypothetical protein
LEHGDWGLAGPVIGACNIVPIPDPRLGKNQRAVEARLFDLWEDRRAPEGAVVIPTRGEYFERAFVIQGRQRELSHVVRATHPASSLTGLLHSRQEQSDENSDDSDDHKQFHKSKALTTSKTHPLDLRFIELKEV